MIKKICISEDTVLFGRGGELDSLAFITLISTLEERLSKLAKKEIHIPLDTLLELDALAPFITNRQLAIQVESYINAST
jgi:acyl carrier protein